VCFAPFPVLSLVKRVLPFVSISALSFSFFFRWWWYGRWPARFLFRFFFTSVNEFLPISVLYSTSAPSTLLLRCVSFFFLLSCFWTVLALPRRWYYFLAVVLCTFQPSFPFAANSQHYASPWPRSACIPFLLRIE
jgi:hypothetical protein